MSLLKELNQIIQDGFYKYFTPNGAKNGLDKRAFFT